MDADDVMHMMFGPPGTTVNLIVGRGLNSSDSLLPGSPSPNGSYASSGSISAMSPMPPPPLVSSMSARSPMNSPLALLPPAGQTTQAMRGSAANPRSSRDVSPQRSPVASVRTSRDVSPRRDAHFSPQQQGSFSSRRGSGSLGNGAVSPQREGSFSGSFSARRASLTSPQQQSSFSQQGSFSSRRNSTSPVRRDTSPQREGIARNGASSPLSARGAASPLNGSFSARRASLGSNGERGSGGKYSSDNYSSTPPRNMDMGKVTAPRAGQPRMSLSSELDGVSLEAELQRLQVPLQNLTHVKHT